ncbi:hypothetical protein EN41_17605 [Agrobacterium tumefaciens]|uniref:Phage tail fiber protein n=1 Tax=Agrobacterium fabrum (strain C58 / ATCC 33970) TaxID=176299 RepID=Q7CZT0_AGRFC|nr:phage tail fiber protein [Agrobacterium fabrum]KEY55579.1 hypothetical protein EN41_17605 [Agrobacterium tumefaciens]AAK86990.2 phage tail fiber protein [Agrobacterium fabrum str. C58]KJX88747.1 NACHT, LRR and PYD domains-containing protein 5 [Agrobacterium tumefaciens]MCX2873982.1 phage tail fiber protein [Agrobacterium fabrum]NMV68140.1 hypothetical protein [Agrobacterium fabrum]
MPLSYAHSSGDGSNRLFDVPCEYLSKAHVTVRVDGVLVPFSWIDTYRLQTTTAPPSGSVVEVRRVTPRVDRLVTFTDGSTLVQSDLNTSTLQSFFLAQEAFDQGAASMAVTEDGQFSALNRRITSLANPVSAQDAVTKLWAETAMSSQLVLATQKALDAATSAAQSEASAAFSDSRAAAALASKNAAAGSATAAAQSEANALANKNQTQLDRAATAADRVQTGLDREASAASAAAAKKSAEDAALFDPSSYYTKSQADARYPAKADAATKAQLDALAAIVDDPWATQPLGVPIPASMGIAGTAYPPTNNPRYRYIILTAGQTGSGGYNNGVLTSEAVTGSWPAISAAAIINLAGSPFNGRQVQLINTSRAFLRPGNGGAHQYFAVQSHNHGVNDPGHAHGGVQNGTASTGRSTSVDQPPAVFSFGNTWGATTGISIQYAGDEETRPRNFGVDYVMRIK